MGLSQSRGSDFPAVSGQLPSSTLLYSVQSSGQVLDGAINSSPVSKHKERLERDRGWHLETWGCELSSCGGRGQL